MSTFEEAFEETGHGVFNHIVLLTSGLVLLYVMMESLGVGYVIALAECDLRLTPSQKGLINAAAFIGIFMMAIFWGYLSDRYGRRAVMIPAIGAGTLVSFASSLSGDFLTLFLLRLLTGCLLSASSATVYAYLAEMHTDEKRASAIAYGSTFIALTFIFLSILAWVILPGKWSFNIGSVRVVPWRVFIWSWCTPGLVAGVILFFLPESPRYLYVAKGQAAALPVLARIYAWNHRAMKKEDFPVKSITIVSAAIAQRGFCKAFSNFGQLMRAPLRRCVLISHFSMFMVFLLSSGLYTWMPFILNEMLNNVKKPWSMCSIMLERYRLAQNVTEACDMETLNPVVYPLLMVVGVACSITYIGTGYAMRPSNKIVIYCSLLASTSSLLLVAGTVPQPIVAIIMFILTLTSGIAASILAAIAVEVFPTSVRALALCTLYMLGRTGAAAGANLVGLGLRQNCIVIFCMNSLVTAGSTLLMLLWPDPKKVRTIMEARGFAY